jgi:hypothetical protein
MLLPRQRSSNMQVSRNGMIGRWTSTFIELLRKWRPSSCRRDERESKRGGTATGSIHTDDAGLIGEVHILSGGGSSGSRTWRLLTLCFILNHVLPEALNEFAFLPVHKL